ncbi:phenylacetic acid degradation protein [Arthrobacter sp. MYb211]|uniref:1,2-phenylacetyl-CoA epoxidase subunit PaaE n=1 Tax=unclassified Arthrobacter TaxID=235627 RepID=UPI000CFA8AFF|nr:MULTISPECIES: 1,2-phenylacetyl-CoA epoxidase subunit PaaE [unclassified Arthrobacter]PQZ99522.1 phenylacetic acid degradation protein [Arthrobacter sp. MYb224]PRA11218.1 phenylacetic acid degradation protein [Arthrobacter sp. MYb221]PRC07610.1 phenylacetic acid degradation protein [Arthrobacter sp. MYb211]
MSEQTTPTRRRATFHRLTVAEVRRLTKDSIEVSFAIPAELSSDFDYLAGQYVALRKELPNAEGELVEVRRSYSICAAPTGELIKVAIKRDLGGQFSTWANEELVAGDQIDVMSPTGAFISKHKLTEMNDPSSVDTVNQDQFVAVAAGSGITPVLAIARTILEANENTRFDLIYANKAAMDVMFLEELADLKDRYPARLALHHVLSREQRISPLLSGRIDAEKLSALLTNVLQAPKVDEWFLCGPFELVQMVRDQLTELEVPSEKVRFELFTTGEPNRPQGHVGRPVLVDENEKSIEISFTLDGLQGEVKSPVRANETVLNAALRVRQDVPFACAGGVCGTCRAKVTSGTVTMAENYALEPEEVEAGYVLTCQSHPTSDKLSVNFDS